MVKIWYHASKGTYWFILHERSTIPFETNVLLFLLFLSCLNIALNNLRDK